MSPLVPPGVGAPAKPIWLMDAIIFLTSIALLVAVETPVTMSMEVRVLAALSMSSISIEFQ